MKVRPRRLFIFRQWNDMSFIVRKRRDKTRVGRRRGSGRRSERKKEMEAVTVKAFSLSSQWPPLKHLFKSTAFPLRRRSSSSSSSYSLLIRSCSSATTTSTPAARNRRSSSSSSSSTTSSPESVRAIRLQKVAFLNQSSNSSISFQTSTNFMSIVFGCWENFGKVYNLKP